MSDIKQELAAYVIRNAVDGKASHPVSFSPEEGTPVLIFEVDGLRPVDKPEPSPYGGQKFIEPQGLAKIHPQDIGDVHRIINAVAKLVPFGDQNRAIKTDVSGQKATIRIDTSLIDAGRLAAAGH